jgi:hypothetical protein
LGGNGLSLEPGRDGLAHIARTRGAGTLETDIITFSFSTRSFVNGPTNPIRPRNADGSIITNCRVASALIDGRNICLTWEESAQGRIVLMEADGAFLDDAPVGAGASDIHIR